MYYELNLKKLDLLMTKKGYSFSRLSRESGVGRVTLSRMIRKHTTPRKETIYKIAKTLDVNVDELLIEL